MMRLWFADKCYLIKIFFNFCCKLTKTFNTKTKVTLHLRGPDFEYHPRHRILGLSTYNLVTMPLSSSVPTGKCLENSLYQATTASFHFFCSSLLMNHSAVAILTVYSTKHSLHSEQVLITVIIAFCMHACACEREE